MPLKVSDGIGAWITDFKKSDAPQFKSKTDKERRDMALAAYMSAKNENVKTADRKPEMYTKPDGKRGVRMIPVDREVVKNESVQEAAEHEMKVGGYQTTHFYMCPSAFKAMEKHSDVDGAEELTRMQDDYFKFEKEFMNKEPSDADKAKAIVMYSKIMAKAKQAGIERDVKPYMMDHRDSITKGDPKPGFGKVDGDMDESVNEVKQPPKKEVMKAIGHTKNAVQGRAALRKKYGVSDKEADDMIYKAMTEEATFKVNIEGLPMMFMSGMGTGDVKAKLRAIVKQPKMIKDVERVTDAEVKKNFRLKAQGRDEEDRVDESSYDKINKYHDAANKSKDRATNSAVATILRKGDHSKDLNTMRKREKGIKLAKSRAISKIRKGQKS